MLRYTPRRSLPSVMIGPMYSAGATMRALPRNRHPFREKGSTTLTSTTGFQRRFSSVPAEAMSATQPLSPPMLDGIVATCLAKAPDDRWQTAGDIGRQLKRSFEARGMTCLTGTKVDGVYDKDPMKHADATRYERLTYNDVLRLDLRVMDATAFALARENRLPIIVFSVAEKGAIEQVLRGQGRATVVG